MMMVYIVQVLVEHPTHALDTTFDYLANTEIASGVRVTIAFGYQRIIGYVTGCRYSNSTKEELETAAGFKYRYISEVIDERPLLNQELQELSLTLAKLTLSPRISCLQAMLPLYGGFPFPHVYRGKFPFPGSREVTLPF